MVEKTPQSKILLRLLIFSGFILAIAFLVSQSVGLGAGGFDTENILKQFNFYTAGGFYLGIVIIFFFVLMLMRKGDEYGDSVAYVSQGEYPSLSFFRRFSSFQLILLSSIIFGFLGLFLVIRGQRTLTGLQVLTQQQFTPIGSILYSSALIPASENLGAAAVIAISIFLLVFIGIRTNLNKNNFRIFYFLGIPLVVMFYWVTNHLLRYGGSDLSLLVVGIFGLIGGFITVLTGSFIPFWIMHIANNLFVDLRRFYNSELITIWTIGILIFFVVYYSLVYVFKLNSLRLLRI